MDGFTQIVPAVIGRDTGSTPEVVEAILTAYTNGVNSATASIQISQPCGVLLYCCRPAIRKQLRGTPKTVASRYYQLLSEYALTAVFLREK